MEIGAKQLEHAVLMYYFPIAAVTNCHKFSSLKQHRNTLLQFWRSEVRNGSHGAKIKASAELGSFCRV